MKKLGTRQDDFKLRRKHLSTLSNQDLKEYFWELAKKTSDPLIELAKKHTSPAIERSILLRMGLSSLEAKALVEKVIKLNLMPKGAGGVLYRYSHIAKKTIDEAASDLLNDIGWDKVLNSYGRPSV